MNRAKLMMGATAAACLVVSGCIVEARPRRVYVEPAPAGVVVEPAPAPEAEIAVGVEQPAAEVEVVPVAPGPASVYFWIGGWYGWEGGHWMWHRGYWARRPHAGAVWVPHKWVRGPHGGWVHGGGYWH